MERRNFFKLWGVSGVSSALMNTLPEQATAMPGPYATLKISDVKLYEVSTRADGGVRQIFLEVLTDSGPSGLHGPINGEQAYIIRSKLKSLLVGRDPLAGEDLWERMRRRDRHARGGHMMMAISAVDNALWDLRGKHYGVPVHRLLGGPTREKVRTYGSMLGHSTEPEEAGSIAKDFYDRGFTAQKWFFDYFPKDGYEGKRKNIELAFQLRESVGEDADLLFDGRWGWDVPYALAMARAMMPINPFWLEEPLHPEQLEGYVRIKRDTGIPLASGEHFYTRWNVKQYLDAGALDFVQADPEWCGGITELVKICTFCESYEVQVVPHGHCLLPALHVVASQNQVVCPLVEYLYLGQTRRKQYFQKPMYVPESGYLTLPTEPGLGADLDETKIERKQELTWE
jgi:L-alanine-DL-glutamate epimerase-like enolase superfamily enzyme